MGRKPTTLVVGVRQQNQILKLFINIKVRIFLHINTTENIKYIN